MPFASLYQFLPHLTPVQDLATNTTHPIRARINTHRIREHTNTLPIQVAINTRPIRVRTTMPLIRVRTTMRRPLTTLRESTEILLHLLPTTHHQSPYGYLFVLAAAADTAFGTASIAPTRAISLPIWGPGGDGSPLEVGAFFLCSAGLPGYR